MRRHNSFPKAGDRIRLAIPLPADTSEPHARYGTVLERSCGRSNALRVRWDREAGPTALASDAGGETWLADAGWYWDKAHLEVVDDRSAGARTTPVAALNRAPASEEDAWLSASPRAASPSGGVDGSLDAVAEWEAALASEVGGHGDASWEELLANALGNGATLPTPPQAAPAPAPRRPAADRRTYEEQPASGPAPQPMPEHRDVRKRPASPDARDVDEPEVQETPVAKPVQGWKGDDILPSPRSGGKRWGRR